MRYALIVAALSGHDGVTSALLEAGVPPKHPMREDTSFHHLVNYLQTHASMPTGCIKAIIECVVGAQTLFSVVLGLGHFSCARALADADPNARLSMTGNTVALAAIEFVAALQMPLPESDARAVACLGELFDSGMELSAQEAENVFVLAARCAGLATLEEILRRCPGFDPRTARYQGRHTILRGHTALRMAVAVQATDTARWLLQHCGVDIEDCSQDVDRATTLMRACANADPETVTMLLQLGANPNARDAQGLNSVAYAVRGNARARRPETIAAWSTAAARCAKLLLDHGATAAPAAPPAEPYHLLPRITCETFAGGQQDGWDRLLPRLIAAGADLEGRWGPAGGSTALLHAARQGKPGAVRALCAHGADILAGSGAADPQGCAPLLAVAMTMAQFDHVCSRVRDDVALDEFLWTAEGPWAPEGAGAAAPAATAASHSAGSSGTARRCSCCGGAGAAPPPKSCLSWCLLASAEELITQGADPAAGSGPQGFSPLETVLQDWRADWLPQDTQWTQTAWWSQPRAAWHRAAVLALAPRGRELPERLEGPDGVLLASAALEHAKLRAKTLRRAADEGPGGALQKAARAAFARLLPEACGDDALALFPFVYSGALRREWWRIREVHLRPVERAAYAAVCRDVAKRASVAARHVAAHGAMAAMEAGSDKAQAMAGMRALFAIAYSGEVNWAAERFEEEAAEAQAALAAAAEDAEAQAVWLEGLLADVAQRWREEQQNLPPPPPPQPHVVHFVPWWFPGADSETDDDEDESD